MNADGQVGKRRGRPMGETVAMRRTKPGRPLAEEVAESEQGAQRVVRRWVVLDLELDREMRRKMAHLPGKTYSGAVEDAIRLYVQMSSGPPA